MLPTAADDGDGVVNDIDQCPDTPAGAPVNDKGCWIVDNVEFDFNKFDIKSEFIPGLVEIADVREATQEEVDHGHAHGPGGHQH